MDGGCRGWRPLPGTDLPRRRGRGLDRAARGNMRGMEAVRSRLRRLARAVAYGVAVAAALGALTFLVRTKFGPLASLDQNAIIAATDFTRSHDGFRSAARAWEAISQPWSVYVFVGFPACVLAWAKWELRTRALWAAATMTAGWLVASGLKLVVQRARPVIEDPFIAHHGYSFPSGHAANNAIVATTLFLLFLPVLGRTGRRVILAVGTTWVLVTCADRLFMGAHFPSDVTAGVLLGVGLCTASYAGYVGWSPPVPTEKEATAALRDHVA